MPRTPQFLTRTLVASVAVLLAGACEDAFVPTTPTEDTAPLPHVIACRAEVAAGTISCEGPKGDPVPGLSLSVILGGQGTFVQLASSNVEYNAGSQQFSAEVTVQNLIGQALGTTDGTTLDDEGIRVFFHEGPTVTATDPPGSSVMVTVANADGTGTFTGSNQPYFQYDEVLATGETSAPLPWVWNVPSSVLTFTFAVFVAAPVPYPDGWVEISPLISPPGVAWVAPNGTLQLSAVPRDVVGRAVQTSVTWLSSNESVATVSETGLVTGVDYGVVYILAGIAGSEASGVAAIIVDGFSGSWSAVSTGLEHTCGLDSNGKAYCWGNGPTGRLGIGLLATVSQAFNVWNGFLIRRFQSISAGWNHTCAAAQSLWAEEGYCWGYNSYGTLGSGDFIERLAPWPVVGGLSFSQVTAGEVHTCALSTGGAAWCWGSNENGQLGTGAQGGGSPVPQQVTGGFSFSAISTKYRHTCAVTTAGEAYCWGENLNKKLGIGSNASFVSTPGRVITAEMPPPGLFRSVSAGQDHTCGVTPSNEAYCWGENGPKIGRPYTVFPNYPVPVSVQGGHAFATVSAGRRHTCGVTTGGEAYCWGENLNGELGDGTTVDRYAPTRVTGEYTFLSVSAGQEHTCGVTTDGDLYCWGYGLYGRLGNLESGPNVFRTPQPVADPWDDWMYFGGAEAQFPMGLDLTQLPSRPGRRIH